MKISYNWLKQFIEIDWNADKTAALLTDLGLEVEGVSEFESVKGGLQGVVVGEVLTCVKHPNADRLSLTTVSIGGDEPLQIVCGAPNVAKGQKVPVATVGTTLYTPEGESWVIKKGKIRGEVSQGMICAEDEIGLGDSHDGIMVLDPDLDPGTPCNQVFKVESDQIFDIGLTPNRSDAMSHFGVARDLRAGLIQQGINKGIITPSVMNFAVDKRNLQIPIDVQNPELAPRYCGITITDLTIKPSPNWLQNRLRAIGINPKNNVVDITNYVLHDLGQPLHAFDADKIKGNKIVVKTLEAGTKFTTLDDIERSLDAEDLMICDAEKPLCIAGVFGGKNSGVTEDTRAVFLESAYFNPVSVRKSAKRHGLNTDASFRFERGIDIEFVDYALKRAALLIKELAGGTISSDVEDLYPKKKEDHQVFLTFDRINSLIGQQIPREVIKSILTSLEIKVNNVTESGMGLTIPFYRTDVQREVDVIEEILRVYGYNNIEFDTKVNASIAQMSAFDDHRVQNRTGNLLASQGFYEILTNSLSSEKYKDLLAVDGEAVSMLNPLSADLSTLRTTMLFTGLETIAYNINRRKSNLKLFEFGKTYRRNEDDFKEQKHLSIYISGNREVDSWNSLERASDFFYLKSVVENTLDRLGVTFNKTSQASSDLFSEGLTYHYKKRELVSFGIVKKSICNQFDIKQEVLFADFNWDSILSLLPKGEIKFREIPKYPEVKRDFALLIPEEHQFESLKTAAFNTERKFLKEVSLFDVYTGKNLPKGKKSYGLSFTLLNEESTLADKQIDKIMSKLQQTFERDFDAQLR
jgi:phenylalanyl-tRNA synthetase beta chain